ncbi:MAG: HAMP domain-containing protein [Alphaproteobacteria bacterium]|nr:HAMP domain-containing protein [Alphaproteobacteria bacterium]
MSRLVPKSLFAQTLLILLVGLIVSYLVGTWIYAGDRQAAVREVGGLAAAQRVANLTQLIAETAPDARQHVVGELSDPTFRVALAESPPAFAKAEERTAATDVIKGFLAQQLPAGMAHEVRVAVTGILGPPFFMMADHPMPVGMMMHAATQWRGLQVAVELADGSWLSFTTALPDAGPAFSWQFIVSIAVMALIVFAVSAWAVRRVTAPLGVLAQASERLGRDMNAPALPEIGTAEMRQASRSFNQMQERIQRLVENRTRLLAAISHDLRTPLTLLRLRAENVESAEDREKILATIADMDAMIGATLAFAKDEAAAEPRQRADLGALLASIADDMADAGLPVGLESCEAVIIECQPGALKRALTNLLDNAVKYGKKAHAALRVTPARVEITIDDEGPGIPEEDLTRVFQPFYRVETSRSRETGGIGLGLAIALSIVQAHGGELKLANRREGGLRATVTLPL